jgi:hypothetical protein
LQNKNFLQENTIELGRESKPLIVDINNDQILDLLVSNFGEFDLSIPIHYNSYIESYENVGTNENPVFKKISSDFQNISSQINDINLIPTLGDLDGDGDLDAIVGDYSGKLHFLENVSSNPAIINLTTSISPLTDIFNNVFDFGFNAHPTLFDVDNDNDLDLVVGEAIGNLNYIENIGDSINFNFDLRSETFGGVSVSEWWTNIGMSSPIFYRNGSDIELYVGSKRGAIYKYNNIDNNLLGSFNLVDSNFNNIFTGTHSTPAISDLNNDSLIDFIIGNKRGGLSLFMGSNDSLISTLRTPNKLENKYEIFPVPARDFINVKNLKKLLYFEVITLTGRKVKTGYTKGTIPISKLNNGIYFIMLEDGIHRNILKFVKC